MASIKPSYNTNRTVLGEQLPLDTPFSIVLDLSESCNFRCSYCFRAGKKDESWSFAAAGDLMSQAVFERAARQLKEFPQKLKLISLSGHGEPLCNPNIVDMVRFLKKLDVTEQIDMHTNASLLTEESAVRIAQAGFTRIVVSLQGLDAAAYERTCGAKMDFQQFYNNLKLMYENKNKNLRIHIKIADAALGKDSVQENERSFYALFDGITDNVSVEKAVPLWQNINFNTDTTANKFGYAFGEVNYCSLLFYKMLVAPGGEIYPCTNLPPPMSLGNIRDITLQEAWNSRKRLEFLKEHLGLTRYKHTPCEGCFVPVNTVTSSEDIIDPYRDVILDRLEDISHHE
ncbi:MAG: Radical protein [Firmicutes bacterium]|nr:Radical protein [Bacillota bacterium]